MLKIKVKPNEFLKIGDAIITIRQSPNSRDFTVVIDAPKEIRIVRESAKNKFPKEII